MKEFTIYDYNGTEKNGRLRFVKNQCYYEI